MNAKRLPCTTSRVKPAGADRGSGQHRRERETRELHDPTIITTHLSKEPPEGAQPCKAHGCRATLSPPSSPRLLEARVS